MSIILMTIFVSIPIVLGSIVLFATFRHWLQEWKLKDKKQ